jgi:hypothetical protein
MFPSPNGNQYTISVNGIRNSNVTIIALGNCFDNPPLRPQTPFLFFLINNRHLLKIVISEHRTRI